MNEPPVSANAPLFLVVTGAMLLCLVVAWWVERPRKP